MNVNNNNTNTTASQQIKRRKFESSIVPMEIDNTVQSSSLLDSLYLVLKELEFVYNPLDTQQLLRCIVTLQTIMNVFVKYDPSKISIVIAKLIFCAKASFTNSIDEKNYLATKTNIYRVIINCIETLATKLEPSILSQMEDLNLLLTLAWNGKTTISFPELSDSNSEEIVSLCKKCLQLITLPIWDSSETKKIYAYCINKESRIPLKCACIENIPLLYYYSGITIEEASSMLYVFKIINITNFNLQEFMWN